MCGCLYCKSSEKRRKQQEEKKDSWLAVRVRFASPVRFARVKLKGGQPVAVRYFHFALRIEAKILSRQSRTPVEIASLRSQ
jgi:hypothetical protein